MAAGPERKTSTRVEIWDWPVRICHWSFVVLIPLAWWTAEEHMLDWHFRIGILLFILLLFRLIWGLAGSSTARFSSFLAGPATAISYVRGTLPPRIGHNPLGGWSVAALLLAMVVQVGLGMFATDDDGLESGPLNHLVSYESAETITELHEMNFNILLALIGLHIGAILFYAIARRKDLIRPMVTGKARAEAATEPMRKASGARLAIALVLAFGIGWWVNAGAPI